MEIIRNMKGRCWRGGNKRHLILVHHTGSSTQTTLDQILRFFGKSELLSVHYVVGKKGEIVQMVEEKDRAWHAGRSEWRGQHNLNHISIGIEILSDGHSFTDEQREAVKWLCKDIMRRNHIKPHNVLRHADVSPNRKWDISPEFYIPYFGKSWADFQMALVRKP